MVAFFTGPFAKLLDDNYVQEKVKAWVSPDIMRNMSKPYSDSADFKEGTVLEYILRYGRIESVNQTFKLIGTGTYTAPTTTKYHGVGDCYHAGSNFYSATIEHASHGIHASAKSQSDLDGIYSRVKARLSERGISVH